MVAWYTAQMNTSETQPDVKKPRKAIRRAVAVVAGASILGLIGLPAAREDITNMHQQRRQVHEAADRQQHAMKAMLSAPFTPGLVTHELVKMNVDDCEADGIRCDVLATATYATNDIYDIAAQLQDRYQKKAGLQPQKLYDGTINTLQEAAGLSQFVLEYHPDPVDKPDKVKGAEFDLEATINCQAGFPDTPYMPMSNSSEVRDKGVCVAKVTWEQQPPKDLYAGGQVYISGVAQASS